jgi:hypothetical protein
MKSGLKGWDVTDVAILGSVLYIEFLIYDEAGSKFG